MALPSKAKQVEAVMKFLDSDATEGRELKDIATDIVNGYLDGLTRAIRKPITVPRVGMYFRTPEVATRTLRVLYLDGDTVWWAAENSKYGELGPVFDDFWQYCEEFVPQSLEKYEAAWTNPDWVVGDEVSLMQRVNRFEIIATGPSCVLMRDRRGVLYAEPNGNLDKFYRREQKMGKVEW